jgi:hypothetical protein
MAKRKAKVENKKDLLVDLRPEFAAALKQTLSFSSKFTSITSHFSIKGEKCFPLEIIIKEEED